MTMQIEIWKGRGKQPWRWHIRAKNGKVVADAEGFPTRNHARRASIAHVRAIIKCATKAFAVFEIWYPGTIASVKGNVMVIRWS